MSVFPLLENKAGEIPASQADVDERIRNRFFSVDEIIDHKARRSKGHRPSGSTDLMSGADWKTHRIEDPVRLYMAEKGALSQRPITIMKAVRMTTDRYPDNDAFAVRVNGRWQKTKLKDVYLQMRTVAKGFQRLGLSRFYGVGIMGHNSPEWILSFLGAIFAGGVAVAIHPQMALPLCQMIATETRCSIMVVDSEDELHKVLQLKPTIHSLVSIVQYGENKTIGPLAGVVTWEKLMQIGEMGSDERLDETIAAQSPNYCCSVCSTPGTFGTPKLVMLSHDNMIWTAKVFAKYQSFSSSRGGVHLSYLPLSLITVQVIDISVPMLYATTVYFVPKDSLKSGAGLIQIMREVRPTFFGSYSQFYNLLYDRFNLWLDSNPWRRFWILQAMKVGRRSMENTRRGKGRPCGWWWANRFVFRKIRRRFGMDRCVEVNTTTLFLSRRTAELFSSLDIHIQEHYGSTELSGIHCLSLMDRCRPGSCGVEMDGCQTKLSLIEGTPFTEICAKGRNVFMGYLNQRKLTMEAFDEEGWFRTGDIGTKDEDGYLYLDGRIENLIYLSDGYVVSPEKLEMTIREKLPCINSCLLVGHNRPFLVLLIAVAAIVDASGVPTDDLAPKAAKWFRRLTSEPLTVSRLHLNPPPPVVEAIQGIVNQTNEGAEVQAKTIRKWRILPRDLTVAAGDMTSTRKLLRRKTEDAFRTLIESMYETTN